MGEQTVNIDADIVFSDNGVIVGNITHTIGTSTITLENGGNYTIWFYVAGTMPNQFTLFLNDNPVVGSIYGSLSENQPNIGMVIITADVGDVLTVRNHTSITDIILPATPGGTQTTSNASILIQKIS